MLIGEQREKKNIPATLRYEEEQELISWDCMNVEDHEQVQDEVLKSLQSSVGITQPSVPSSCRLLFHLAAMPRIQCRWMTRLYNHWWGELSCSRR
jgi:hypothetical protein